MKIKIYVSKSLEKIVRDDIVHFYGYRTDGMNNRYYIADNENHADVESWRFTGIFDDSKGYFDD